MDGVKKINEYVIKDGRTLVVTTYIDDTSKLPEGSIYINPTTGELKYINLASDGTKTWKHFKSEMLFDKDSFDPSLIAENSIHAAKLIDLSIAADKIADKTITADKIADKTITDLKFDINSIDADKLKDGSIITSKIHDNSIVSKLIVNNAITTEKVEDKAITLEKMADSSISTGNIIDKAIITAKIADKAITNDQLADKSINSSNINVKEVKTNNIDNLAVTYEKIADGAIQAKKIPNFGVKDDHIDSMDGYKIFDNSITSAKIKNNSIITSLIIDKAVTIAKLDSDTQALINNSIKIQPVVTIDNIEHYDTAHIDGSVIMKNLNGTKANLEVNGDIKSTGDITGARVFNPYFADVAEAYITIGHLLPGDPVALSESGDLRVEKLTENNMDRFLGFVSNNYATLLGGDKEEINSGLKVPICLIGRIRIKLPLTLPGNIGDYLCIRMGQFVTSKRRTEFAIGRLLENKISGQSTVLCQLWP